MSTPDLANELHTIRTNIFRQLQCPIIRRALRTRDVVHHAYIRTQEVSTLEPNEAVCSAPISSASWAVSERAVKMRSFAFATPSKRVNLCVPPAPGMIPSRTSGRPILVTACPVRERGPNQHCACVLARPAPSANGSP